MGELDLPRDVRLDALVDQAIDIVDVPRRLPAELAETVLGLPPAIRYPGADRPFRQVRMFAVEVRDSIMIAHALADPFFGPAANKHGATFIVDVAFMAASLTPLNVVVDIGAAQTALKAVLAPLHYQDLDVLPQFVGALTTAEFLSRYIHDGLVAAIRRGDLGGGRKAWPRSG